MSWSLRDYRHQGPQAAPVDSLPPPERHDDEPLPTYAAGLEQYPEQGFLAEDGQLPAWQRLEMRRQGYPTERELTRMGRWMRRGVTEE